MSAPAPEPGDRMRTHTGRRLEYIRRGACQGHWIWWADERLKMATYVSESEWRDWKPVVERRVH